MTFVHHEQGGGVSGPRRNRLVSILRAVITGWALAGGLILLVLVVITAASALSNVFFARPFTGEYELAKHFAAIAIFTFLPYCQVTGSNVTVDIFTEGMSHRAKAAMLVLSSLFAIAFAALLLRQMSYGFVDYLEYPETTPTLRLPLWTAFPPILISLALLLAAGLVNAWEGWRGMRTGAAAPGPTLPTPH